MSTSQKYQARTSHGAKDEPKYLTLSLTTTTATMTKLRRRRRRQEDETTHGAETAEGPEALAVDSRTHPR